MIIFIIDNDNHYQLIVINGKVKQSFRKMSFLALQAKKGNDEMNVRGIEGKIALITGAAQGIGEAVARTLAGQGRTLLRLITIQKSLKKS